MNPSNSLNKFKKPQFQEGMNPVDFFNENPDTKVFARIEKNWEYLPSENAIFIKDTTHKVVYVDKGKLIYHSPEAYPQTIDKPFNWLCEKIFKYDYRQAIQWVEFELLNKEIPYIRVGVDYFKVIKKRTAFEFYARELKKWNKETIKQDHDNKLLNRVHCFDDFTIEPDNIDFKQHIDGLWNLHQPFVHKPHDKPVTTQDFKTIAAFMAHIFGDQIELGYKYLKVLYQFPKQMLPVLALVSDERQTGKSTFIEFLQSIFISNCVNVAPEAFMSQFNSAYAYANIICIDETPEKKDKNAAVSVEKVKSISTAKTIMVNEKNVSMFTIPFYGKIVIASNRVKDFMRIDSHEIRFWVRYIPSISKEKMIGTAYLEKLKQEIPFFLRYLIDNISVEFGRSRMVFTADELNNDYLTAVKKESESWMKKELEILITDFFENNEQIKEFQATPKEIKEKWFGHNNQVQASYIAKVLKEEMNLMTPDVTVRYYPFGRQHGIDSKPGKPYTFSHETVNYQAREKGNYKENGSLPF